MNKTKKELLWKLVEKKCEQCKKKISIENADVHRIKRGVSGGTYDHKNCLILCRKCHRLYHSNEFK